MPFAAHRIKYVCLPENNHVIAYEDVVYLSFSNFGIFYVLGVLFYVLASEF